MYLNLEPSLEADTLLIKVLKELVLTEGIGYVLPLPITPRIKDLIDDSKLTTLINDVEVSDNLILSKGLYNVLIIPDKSLVIREGEILLKYTSDEIANADIPKPVTASDLTDGFFDRLHNLTTYWSKGDSDTKEVLESFCFSMLAEMDGCGPSPGIVLSGYSGGTENVIDDIIEGQDYILPDTILYGDGALHELWYPFITDKESKK